MNESNIGVVRLRAGVGEKNMVELGGRDFHQSACELDGRLVGTLEEVIVVRQRL